MPATRESILAAAAALFERRGIEETSIQEIAAEAGVSVGSLYRTFGGKEAIAVDYIDGVVGVLDQYLTEARRDPSPLQRLMGCGDAYLRFSVEYPIVARYAAVRGMQPDFEEPHKATSEALVRRVRVMLLDSARDLKDAMGDGSIPTVPVDAAMVFLWGAWNGVATMAARLDPLAIPPELAARALTLGRELLEGRHGPFASPSQPTGEEPEG